MSSVLNAASKYGDGELPHLSEALGSGEVGRELLEVTPDTSYESALSALQPGEYLYALAGPQGLSSAVEDEAQFMFYAKTFRSSSLRFFALDAATDAYYG